MADQLRVQPDALRRAGTAIGDHGETLHTVQQRCHGQAQDAHSGWVGSSAAALAGLLDDWTTTSTAQLGRIGRHSCDMHSAAAEFTVMEQDNTRALRSVLPARGADPGL